MADIARSVELWATLTRVCNQQALENWGKIGKSNDVIWNDCLHQLDNEDWHGLFSAVALALEQHYECFTKSHIKAIMQAAHHLQKNKLNNPRCLDTKEHKQLAWAALMAMREAYNSIEAIPLANDLFQIN